MAGRMLRELYITKGCPVFLISLDKILAVGAIETTWAGLPIFTDSKNTSYDSIFLIVGLHDQPVQIKIDASRLLQLDHQQLRLSLYFQVLVPPIPLPSSIAVIAHTSPSYWPPFQIQLGISWLHAKKTFSAGLWHCNPFLPDLWSYVQGFGYYNIQCRVE